ncbi:MAG: glycosyltransferase family 39 protein [Planctomycetes bacterium]|nr:glycosyltransferase family 39 protein [Planctomycetota bacterium]
MHSAVPGLDPRDSKASRGDLAMAVGVSLLLFIVYILPSLWRPIGETPEARVAVVAREMLRTGDWLIPHLGGETRFNKPPLPYWMSAAAAKALGPDPGGRLVSEQANTLPAAICGALCVFMLMAFACRVFGRAAGLWTGLILGLSALYASWSHQGSGEIPLTFFTAAALLCAAWLACAPRPGVFCALGLGLALGLAMLCKGHIPLLLVLGALLVEAVRRRRFSAHKVLLFILALAMATVVVLPWLAALHARAPEALAVMQAEILSPATSTGHRQSDWPLFYLYQLPSGLMPWSIVLIFIWPLACSRHKCARKESRRSEPLADMLERFLVWAAVVAFIGFELVRKEQDYYLLPLFPPLALGAAVAVSRLSRPGGNAEEFLAWVHLALAVVGSGLLIASPYLVATVWGRPESAPPWEMTIPLGIVTFVLLFVAARQWVDGHAIWAGVCLGIPVFSAMLSWFILNAVRERDRSALAREGYQVESYLKTLGDDVRVYEVRLGASEPELLFYLNRNEIFEIHQLLADTLDKDGRPLPPKPGEPLRVVICPRAVAEKAGVSNSDTEIQVVPLAFGVDGSRFKPFLKKE